MRRIYLDYTATTPVDKRVVDAMAPYFTSTFGNASSIHSFGREAKAALEQSRESIASVIGSRSSEVYFTSGGTESDNTALFGVAAKFGGRKKRLIISSIEHHAILHSAEILRKNGFDVIILPVDPQGVVSEEALLESVTPDTFLVSIIHANNETGVIQNLPRLTAIAHEKGALFHTDAVQSFCKMKFGTEEAGIDLASFTAHKIYGPKGVGALFVKRGIDWQPLLHGGSQERNRRAGTESIPLVVGFSKAAELAAEEMQSEHDRLSRLNSLLRDIISQRVPAALFNSPAKNSLPNILNVSIDSTKMEIDGEALIINMDLVGIAVTSGSACSSGSLQPSHVIKALGRDDNTTMATVRFSFGRYTTEDELAIAAEKFAEIVGRIGKRKKASLNAS
ncbi:MAG: cysteine desulfurase [Bacteroidetes bacterium]|nr:cysteine desulfurase [Bacteroidota bacterium]